MIPADAELTARHEEIPAWDDMAEELKPVLARQMEVYAGFLEHTDHHIGRLLDTLEELGILDDTLLYLHDRRQRCQRRGHDQRHASTSCSSSTARPRSRRPSSWRRTSTSSAARPRTTTTRSAGRTRWTRPYQWTKQVASHWGGTRNGTDRALAQRLQRPRRGPRTSSTTSSTSPPPCSTSPDCRSPTSSTASSRCRCTA